MLIVIRNKDCVDFFPEWLYVNNKMSPFMFVFCISYLTDTTKLLSTGMAQIYTLTCSIWEFPLLHIHLNAWKCQAFKRDLTFPLHSGWYCLNSHLRAEAQVPTFPHQSSTKATSPECANQGVKSHLFGIEVEELAGLHKAPCDVQGVGT